MGYRLQREEFFRMTQSSSPANEDKINISHWRWPLHQTVPEVFLHTAYRYCLTFRVHHRNANIIELIPVP